MIYYNHVCARREKILYEPGIYTLCEIDIWALNQMLFTSRTINSLFMHNFRL